MDDLKDKAFKRLTHFGSKISFSSHTKKEPSHLYGAMAPAVTNSLSMMPAVAQVHRSEFQPENPQAHGADDQEGTRYRAPLTAASAGDKKDANANRLYAIPIPRKKKDKDDKKNDDQKSDDKKNDNKKNVNKSQDSKTGGKSENK